MILCLCMGISEAEYIEIEKKIDNGADITKDIPEDDLIRWNCAGTCCGSCAERIEAIKEEVKNS